MPPGARADARYCHAAGGSPKRPLAAEQHDLYVPPDGCRPLKAHSPLNLLLSV